MESMLVRSIDSDWIRIDRIRINQMESMRLNQSEGSTDTNIVEAHLSLVFVEFDEVLMGSIKQNRIAIRIDRWNK